MIIAHSPTKVETGTFPHRIVLRDLGDQYVVHTEIFEESRKPWYLHGDYFPKKKLDSGAEALRKAWFRFEERSRRLLNIDIEPLYNANTLITGAKPSVVDPRD